MDMGDNPVREPASQETLQLIHQFIMEHKHKHIIVHCEAGVSRSAAVREFLLRKGWKHLPLARQETRQVFPNTHVLAGLERIDRGDDYAKTIDVLVAEKAFKDINATELAKLTPPKLGVPPYEDCC